MPQERIPDIKDEEWKSRQIVFYYQWVPVILLVMSAMSVAPALLWRVLSRRSGIDVSALMMSAAAGQQAGYAELRERTVRYVVNQVTIGTVHLPLTIHGERCNLIRYYAPSLIGGGIKR